MNTAVSILILLTRLHDKAHPVEFLNCDDLSLEIVVEKFVVGAEPENLLLLDVTHDELLHLLIGQLAILVEQPYLMKVSLRILHQLILLLNHIETCLEHPLVFLRMPNSKLTRLLWYKV